MNPLSGFLSRCWLHPRDLARATRRGRKAANDPFARRIREQEAASCVFPAMPFRQIRSKIMRSFMGRDIAGVALAATAALSAAPADAQYYRHYHHHHGDDAAWAV